MKCDAVFSAKILYPIKWHNDVNLFNLNLGINYIQMNRLVIVGNGFDLAHGLPTSYRDFINDFWKYFKDKYQNVDYEKFVYVDPMYCRMVEGDAVGGFVKFEENLKSYAKEYGYTYNKIYQKMYTGSKTIFKFENEFFKIINAKNSIQNWVDIENEYYKLLKECLKEEGDNSLVKKLNEEFEEVKNLLEKYLFENIDSKFDFDSCNDEYKEIVKLFLIKPLFLEDNFDHSYFKEFHRDDYKDLIDFDNSIITANTEGNLQEKIEEGEIIQHNLILNFNYTSTFTKYKNVICNRKRTSQQSTFGYTNQVPIHGTLYDDRNKVNFGFGDEMDNHYKVIEEKDDNEYLRNIKSFQYLQNSNYKNMLDFIEGGKFQVYIMGHSCGLSDRILLNKIFEHHKCRSIKVFYYKKGEWDNYTEIVQNISRHFNKKEMMREKIVNKSLCQPLPQDIRFAKRENGL